MKEIKPRGCAPRRPLLDPPMADPRDVRPLGVQILSFSCSFRPKICTITSTWELVPPLQEYPGSTTGQLSKSTNSVWGNNGGSRGAPGACPPGPKCSQSHAVFCKIWQNHMLAPPGGLAPPPTGNPGSAPGKGTKFLNFLLVVQVLNQFPCYNVISIINSQFFSRAL